MIEIADLTVRFGGVTPLDGMSVKLRRGHVRADRPQRRRQDHVLQRAERLRAPGGGERATPSATTCCAMPHYRRARWGLRRTFQTEQAIEELSVFDNVAMVARALAHERAGSAPRGRARRARVRRPRGRPATTRSARWARASGGWSRSRARSSGGRGSCCSTSPRPGCPTRRPSTSARVIRAIPEHTGALVDPRRPRHEPRLGVLRERPRCWTSAS